MKYGFILLAFIISVSVLAGETPPDGMVLVNGGEFRMGTDDAPGKDGPVHSVRVNRFYIGKFEVTQEEWKAVMKKNPAFRKGNPTPVNCVSWLDAIDYCNERSRKEGLTPCYTGKGDNISCNFEANGYRLPTEAEWEYACRGGALSGNYKYSGSNDPGEVAWYPKTRIYVYQPVGEKKPNELGIYDMSGNVSEWCWDGYDSEYYKTGPSDNPKGPTSVVPCRVIRGGDWNAMEESLRSTHRTFLEPFRRSIFTGLRVVRRIRD
ncbi:MAG: formylglycine-generating enzyme family protein [Candidatus Omnitrophota bacterium]